MKNIYLLLVLIFAFSSCESDLGGGGSASKEFFGGSNTGIGGSLARFAVVGDYLYTLNENTLRTFSLKNPETPVLEKEIDMGFGMETLFPYNDKLFIGAMNGMSIYDNTDGSNPVFIGEYEHVVSCDPVVADDNFAYVTLRGGTGCRSWVNELHILSLANLPNITQVSNTPMTSPRGLSIQDSILYVCEGPHGLKIMNVSDRQNPSTINTIDSLDVNDIIAFNNIVMLIGEGGFYQYETDGRGNLNYISTITIK